MQIINNLIIFRRSAQGHRDQAREPARDWDYEDEREEAEEEVEAEEAEEPSVSMTMQHRDIMYCLERRFRDKFTLYE